MRKTWTEQEEADLRRVWLGEHNLKKSLHLFGGRTYVAVVAAAHRLGLGQRPHSDRGTAFYAREAVLNELQSNGPGTNPELAERTGLTKSIVVRYFKPELAGPDGDFHVLDWRRRPQGGSYVPVFAFGPGENAKRPTPRTNAELCRAKNHRELAKRVLRGDRPRFVNPFATAAGLVAIPQGQTGRIYAQDMTGGFTDREAA